MRTGDLQYAIPHANLEVLVQYWIGMGWKPQGNHVISPLEKDSQYPYQQTMTKKVIDPDEPWDLRMVTRG